MTVSRVPEFARGNKVKTYADLLLRIQNLLNNIGGTGPALDPLSRSILLHVASKEASGEPLQMSDIRFDAQFGSPATALKRLQKLISQGWLSTSPNPQDGRAQLLGITPKAARHMALTSDRIVKLVAEHGRSGRS